MSDRAVGRSANFSPITLKAVSTAVNLNNGVRPKFPTIC